MMLKYTCLFLFFGIGVLTLSAQEREEHDFNHQFLYRLTYQTDSNDESTRKEIDMELLLNDESSLFQSIRKGTTDSAHLVGKKVVPAMLVMTPVYKFNYQIIKTGNTVKTYDSAFGMNLQGVGQIYYYEEPMDAFAWEIKKTPPG